MHQTLTAGLEPGSLAVVAVGVAALILHFAVSTRATVRAIRARREAHRNAEIWGSVLQRVA